jgi:molybdenum cofactor cytidylyltransferase
MKFGPLPLDQAEGAIAAHSVRRGGAVVKKGVRLAAEHIAMLRAAGVEEIVAARLDADDVHEDEAAARVAATVAGKNVRTEAPFTGRCNLYAEQAGVVTVDRAAIDRLNRLDPGLTLATLKEYQPVEAGRMVATVKVIPFAVPCAAVEAAEASGAAASVAIARWRRLKVGLAATILPGLKPSVMDKTRRILDERLRMAGASVIAEERVPHETAALAGALARLEGQGAELIVAFGASAIVDEDDVIPAALREAGGAVEHFGMPVDPGNLLLLGRLGGKPVLGAPGCARSPAENGFDWVLQRLLAGLPVAPQDITGMGVGGLLMEITSRPQPRQPAPTPGRAVAAVVLAAGQSRRMGGPNKLLATIGGVPLVRRAAESALGSRARPVVVVTGHQAEAVASALAGLDVTLVHNPDFSEGLSTSLKAGLAAIPPAIAGALIVLADMPGVTSDLLDRLIAAFAASGQPAIVLPTFGGKRGNPVLWPREFFPELREVSGDTGGRHLIGRHAASVVQVEAGRGAVTDIDTPEALAAAGGAAADAEG